MEQQYCDLCENHCPKEALRCGRGRRKFGLESGEGGHGHEMPSGPIGLLRQCGHLLHHGGVDGGDLLSALSDQEQAELERLLGVLLADWKGRMPADAGAHHHGGGRHH